MPVLHFGVNDLPYSQAPKRFRGKGKVASGTQTTGDVAGWLEDRYHVMEIFGELHIGDIAKSLESSVAGALESLMAGGPSTLNAFGSATSEIEDQFKQFLSNKEMDALGYPGVPTQAALEGINPRLKRGRGPPRPSFIATGLYQANFRAWVD